MVIGLKVDEYIRMYALNNLKLKKYTQMNALFNLKPNLWLPKVSWK